MLLKSMKNTFQSSWEVHIDYLANLQTFAGGLEQSLQHYSKPRGQNTTLPLSLANCKFFNF